MFERIVWVGGMPRSGTNWMSQILASHPDFRLKLCPLFSYAFKDACDASSSAEEWRALFRAVYDTNDEYLDQDYLRRDGHVPAFGERKSSPGILAIKSTRYHHLTSRLLELLPELKFVALVRNPAASIQSWLSNPLEFPEGADPETEWRTGACRKTGPAEFWGFDDWKRVTAGQVDLARTFPDRVRLVHYEDLVKQAGPEIRKLFAWLGMDVPEQTRDFLIASQGIHSPHKRAVFKAAETADTWKERINPEIRWQIGRELAGTPLARFCDWETLAEGAGYRGGRAAQPERVTKRSVDDLAAFGGPTLFATSTPRPIGQLAAPDPKAFGELIDEVYRAHRLSNNGVQVLRLEERLAGLHQVSNCVAFANASLALVTLLSAVAHEDRRDVIVPAFTYVGLPHIIEWAGLRPVFGDVEPNRHTLDPAAVEKLCGADTAAILAVHQVNAPCDHDTFAGISTRTGIPVIYDSVHALGCTLPGGRPVGALGRAEVFSLHATKILNGFEGGYVTTDDDVLAGKLRSLRNFGYADELEIDAIGLNGKLNEIHAAAALSSLGEVDGVLERNEARYRSYLGAFETLEGVHLIPYSDEYERKNYECALLELDKDWPLGRNEVVALLRAENALARNYYDEPLYVHSEYPTAGSDSRPNLPRHVRMPVMPVTDRLARRIVLLPVGERVAERDIEAIVGWFRFVAAHAGEIARRLANPDALV